MPSSKNNLNNEVNYFSTLFPVLKPALSKIGQACIVMSLSVVLLAVVPLIVSDIRKVLNQQQQQQSNQTSLPNEENTNNNNIQETAAPPVEFALIANILRPILTPLFPESFEDIILYISHSAIVQFFATLNSEDIDILLVGGKLLLLLVSHSVISYFGHYLAESASTISSNLLRKEALQSALKLDWSIRLSSSDVNPSAQATTWLESIAAVHDIISNVITNVFPTLVNCVVSFIALYFQSVTIALSLGGFMVLTFLVVKLNERIQQARKAKKQHHHQMSSSSSIMTEGEKMSNVVTEDHANCQGFFTTVLERFSTIKIYEGQNLVTEKFETILHRLEKNRANLAHYIHWTAGNGSRQMTVLYVIAGVIVIILQRKGLIGLLTDLAVVGFYARRLVGSCQSAYEMLIKTSISFAKALPLCKLFIHAKIDQAERDHQQVLLLQQQQKQEGDSSSSTNKKLLVEMKDVGATYSISSSNLDSSSPTKALPGLISCTMKPIHEQDIIILKGPNGHGKSTILKCLASLLKPNKGTLKIQNAKVAMLNQEPVLLAGCTIAENICMQPVHTGTAKSKNIAIMEKVIDAAKRAVCHDVIMNLQKEYETVIDGTGSISGSCLSGGQLQRICVARMLFAEANFLILDEPVNNLDVDSAATILKTVIQEECHKRKCAAVIATHEMKYFVGEKVRIVQVAHGRCNEAEQRE